MWRQLDIEIFSADPWMYKSERPSRWESPCFSRGYPKAPVVGSPVYSQTRATHTSDFILQSGGGRGSVAGAVVPWWGPLFRSEAAGPSCWGCLLLMVQAASSLGNAVSQDPPHPEVACSSWVMQGPRLGLFPQLEIILKGFLTSVQEYLHRALSINQLSPNILSVLSQTLFVSICRERKTIAFPVEEEKRKREVKRRKRRRETEKGSVTGKITLYAWLCYRRRLRSNSKWNTIGK